MTRKLKERSPTLSPALKAAWKARCKLIAQGDRTFARGDRIYDSYVALNAQRDRLSKKIDRCMASPKSHLWRVKGRAVTVQKDLLCWKFNRLTAELEKVRVRQAEFMASGDDCYARCRLLWAEGERRWLEAVLKVYGNIQVTWEYLPAIHQWQCRLENGEVYGYGRRKTVANVDFRKNLHQVVKV